MNKKARISRSEAVVLSGIPELLSVVKYILAPGEESEEIRINLGRGMFLIPLVIKGQGRIRGGYASTAYSSHSGCTGLLTSTNKSVAWLGDFDGDRFTLVAEAGTKRDFEVIILKVLLPARKFKISKLGK